VAAYCTRDDLTAVGVNANALRDVPGASVTSAIAMASDLIDSYLRVQFALPLASAGAELKRAAAIIAAYDLMSARGYNPNEPEDSPLRKRYEDVIAWLEKVAAGAPLPGTWGASSVPTAMSWRCAGWWLGRSAKNI